MDWGVHVPHLGRQVSRELLLGFARECEALDVHSAWVSDHLCWPADITSKYPYTDDGSFAPSTDMSWLEAIGTLTFLAACTERLRLGTSVLILPYRPPVLCAKQLATLDVLSDGRLILGAGVGWMAEEAAVLGMPWESRGKRSDEYLEVLRSLFEQPDPAYDGQFYQFPTVGFEPKPIQTPLPIWIGGNTPAAHRRVVRFGNAFHAAFEPLRVVSEQWAQIQAECVRVGRDPKELRLSLRVFLDPAGAMPPDKSIQGTADEMLARIAELKAIGVDHVLLDPVARGGPQARMDAIRAFMENIAPHA